MGDVLGRLAGGMGETDILADFDEPSAKDRRACLAFAAAEMGHASVTVAA